MRLRENIEKNVCPPLIQWGGGEDISQDFSAPPPPESLRRGTILGRWGGQSHKLEFLRGGDTPLSPPVPALVYDLNSFTFYTLYA